MRMMILVPDLMECAMNSVTYLGKSFFILVLSFSLASIHFLHADPELHSDETQNASILQDGDTEIIAQDFNASTGGVDTAEDALSIDAFMTNLPNQNPNPIGGYVTNTNGKAILVDGRPVLQEAMEDGQPRFQIIEDGNGVKGFCDGLDQTCLPSNLNKFSYEDPDKIPIVLMTYNQHKYDTEGVGESAYANVEDPQPVQPEINTDLTQNEPGTTTPSMREECRNAAKAGSALPSLSRGCIDAANDHLSKPIPTHCATDFIGPLSPSQDQTCSKHSEVKKSAESHEFLGDETQGSKAKKRNEEEQSKNTDKEESDTKSKDEAEKDAESVGNDADEALNKVEEDSKAAPEKRLDGPEVQQEDSANQNSAVNESLGLGMEEINPTSISDKPAEPSQSTTPEDIQNLYGDDPVINSDEDDSMADNVNNEEPTSGGFFSNNSDWFDDDGTLTDPDDFENKAADDDEYSDMEDLLGLGDLGQDAAKEEAERSNEVKQESASPSTGDVSIDNQRNPKSNENLDVESLKINLNAADEDVDTEKLKLSVVDEKTGVKIVKTENGFIAKTFSLKNNADLHNQEDEVKLISRMDKEELMDRFNLSEDELDAKLKECKKTNPKAKNSDCLKEDATLFGDLLIKQD